MAKSNPRGEPTVRMDKGKASARPSKAVKTVVEARMDPQTAKAAKPIKQVKTVVTAKVDKVVAKPQAVRQVKTEVSTKVDKVQPNAKGVKALKQVKAVIHAAPRRKLDL